MGGLRKELERLNQLAWQADEDTILGWADTEGYPVDGTVDSDGQYSKADIPEHTPVSYTHLQVIPLYEDELDYKLEHDTDALLNKMRWISFVVNPTRQDAITRGTLSNDDFDGEMDDASYHIESIEAVSYTHRGTLLGAGQDGRSQADCPP